jgi:glycosyltransferase involved in cell wall biosynthesis
MVSCIIPTYRRSDSLIKAINSVLAQTYKNIEVIVVDDNDPDDKYSIMVQDKLATIKDERLRYIKQERHKNGAAARNTGIKASRGEYIAFLDDDDEWLPEKLEMQIKCLMSNPDYGAVSCLYTYYLNGKLVRNSPIYTNKELHRKVLERSVAVCTPTLLFSKKCLDKSGYFDESLPRHQDLQLVLDFLYHFNIFVLDKYLVKINIDSGENRPKAKDFIEIKNSFFNKMKKHINIYDKRTQKRIYAAHYFEIVFIAVKERNIKIAVSYLLKIGFNLHAYIDVYKRFLARKKNTIKNRR